MQIVLVLPLLLVLTAFLSWFAGYVTHCFFHVLNETAQGRNDVRIDWPSDGFYERLWNAAYLVGLWAVVLFPSLLLARFPELLSSKSETPALLTALIVAAATWLLLPIPFLSVLSGRHHWEVFRWKVVKALARNAAVTGAFYAASAPLIIGGLLVVHFALVGWMEFQEAAAAAPLTWLPDALKVWSWLFVLPLAGAMCAATLLIYARLLGRLSLAARSGGGGGRGAAARTGHPGPQRSTGYPRRPGTGNVGGSRLRRNLWTAGRGARHGTARRAGPRTGDAAFADHPGGPPLGAGGAAGRGLDHGARAAVADPRSAGESAGRAAAPGSWHFPVPLVSRQLGGSGSC